MKFEFPDITGEAKREKEAKKGKTDLQETKKTFNKSVQSSEARRDVPSFFGL